MNERLAAGLLAGLSATLITAEILLAALYGFEPGLILFCLSLYAGAMGLVFSLKQLLEVRGRRIESVSERRARAMRGEGGSNLFEGYDVDEEFIGSGRRSAKPTSGSDRPLDDDALKAVITSYASMAGGLAKLRETIDSIDEAAFRQMARSAGISGVTRARALAAVMELIAREETPEGANAGSPSLTISLDRETFDDYIRRCMTDKEAAIDDNEGAGFSVGLDATGLSGSPSEPPADFSHDPRDVLAKIKRPAGGSR
jgi:hypothetical protein